LAMSSKGLPAGLQKIKLRKSVLTLYQTPPPPSNSQTRSVWWLGSWSGTTWIVMHLNTPTGVF